MDIVTYVLLRFPIIAQRSKGTHCFHRVVGLVVTSMVQPMSKTLWATHIDTNLLCASSQHMPAAVKSGLTVLIQFFVAFAV